MLNKISNHWLHPRLSSSDRRSGTNAPAFAHSYTSSAEWIRREENKSARSQRVVPIVIPRLSEILKDHDGDICPLGDGVRRQINRICAANGLPEVGLHGLRHSFASLAYHLGWPEEETIRHGGWSDWKTVHDFYLRLSEKICPGLQRKCGGSIPLVIPLVKKGQKTLKNAHPPRRPAENNRTGKCRKPLENTHFLSISRGFSVERIMGIEPTSTAWEAVVLPMNYIRVLFCLLVYSTKIYPKSQAAKKDS